MTHANASRTVYWSPATEAAVRDRYRSMLDTWGVEHSEQVLSTSQGDTFVLSAGKRELPAVVLLPGSMATSAMWLRTVPSLADRFHVVAVDIIGDAGFSASSRPPMKSDAHARWMDEILDALELKTVSLVGASFGAWVALDYAIRRHHRVNNMVLLAPAGVGRIWPGFILKAAPFLFMGAWGHRKALNMDMGFSESDAAPADSAFIDLFATVRSGFRARMQPIPVFTDRQLATLDMPILAVVGGRDAIFDSRETQRRLETNADAAEVLMLPDAGHALVDTTPLIRDFLIRDHGAQGVWTPALQ